MWYVNRWINGELLYVESRRLRGGIFKCFLDYPAFFPRASEPFFSPRAFERRVILIVEVCILSSHLYIFSSSYLLIFTSSYLLIFKPPHFHLRIFTSSHFHLLIFTSAHLHIFSSFHLALFFYSISLLKAETRAVPTKRQETQPFRTELAPIVNLCPNSRMWLSPASTKSRHARKL